MNLQAKLTLGFVLLATLMVGLISAVNLDNEMQGQFEATLNRAATLESAATKFVRAAVNARPQLPLPKALRDPALQTDLADLFTSANAILEIAVVDPRSQEILADSSPDRVGKISGPYPDFRALVADAGWREKLGVLLGKDTNYYQLEQPMGDSPANTQLLVRVIIAPALISHDISPALTRNAWVALFTVIGAVSVTLLFSTVAFRPLGRLRKQLELVASGDYGPDEPHNGTGATDEVSIMSSNVSALSQRLRGAQFEVSDLRGNIDHLLHDLEDAVLIFNREHRVVFASGSVEKFLERDRGELAGQSIENVFPFETILGLLIMQAAQTGRPIRNRRVPRAAPEEPQPRVPVVLLSVDMLETLPGARAGSGILVRLRDPEAQRKIGRELQIADRLAALSRVSGGVAHEVKNPLNAILLHMEVAKSKLASGDTDVGQQMEIVSTEILRLDRVVKTFLDFTRPVELNLTMVSLHELVGEIVELARPQAAAAQIRIEVKLEADGVEVRVDRDLLKQAVLNLVVNAMQAMPDGGVLGFEAGAADDKAEIRIVDSGPGIPPELREKIFRLYYTTKKEGSGIGLAMTFRIVQLHDGTIDFASEEGKGTTFFIRLPIAV